MFLSFSNHFTVFFFLISFLPCIFSTRTICSTLHSSKSIDIDEKLFLTAQTGSGIHGISQLKHYFNRFGYLVSKESSNFSDELDTQFQSAISLYQTRLGLTITGRLDLDTIKQINTPRCGVPDNDVIHGTRHYVYFTGKPKWTRQKPITLTYGLSPDNSIDYLSSKDIKGAFRRAFAQWASVIPVSFKEADDYGYADIRIGFYKGDHGDGQPFDGVLGILAHSFSPESGRLHLDAAETWAVDFEAEKSKVAVDLQSVALHEIGHLLGLAHSSVKEAVMYPSLNPREKKLVLTPDDIEGVQALYGSKHHFLFGSLVESDTSVNRAISRRDFAFCRQVILSVDGRRFMKMERAEIVAANEQTFYCRFHLSGDVCHLDENIT